MGRLPLGEAGAVHFCGLQAEVQAFLDQLRPRLGEGYIAPVQVDHTMGDFRLTGEIHRLTAKGLLHYRCASIKAKDLLRMWVQHLVLNTVFSGERHTEAVLVGRDEVLRVPSLEGAPELLAGLLDLYWRGLTRPLKFSRKPPELTPRPRRRESPAGRSRTRPGVARLSWEGNSFTKVPGECEDAYFDLCFRSVDPLDEEFQQTARAVFGPLLSALEEVTA